MSEDAAKMLADVRQRLDYFRTLYHGSSAGNRSAAKGLRRLKALAERQAAELARLRADNAALAAALRDALPYVGGFTADTAAVAKRGRAALKQHGGQS